MNQNHGTAQIVQVGNRDDCEEEYLMNQSRKDIHVFLDAQIKQSLFEGASWQSVVQSIIEPLPEQVYVSLDVDGLSRASFPHTGTPVPGGLSFEQTCYLLEQVVQSGRKIIGFDLVEVAGPPDRWDLWDAQTGMRLLYFLCQRIFLSNSSSSTT